MGFALAAVALLVAGCGGGGNRPGDIGVVEGFAGVVAGDEPRAVVVGRDVLAKGGTAVDAAVAMYFTMAVTMPSRAGLGGGGMCVIFDREEKTGTVIDFMPVATPGGAVAPRGPRAMAALHARYGALRWEQLLAPAETAARLGHPVSRAFAQDLAAETERIAADPVLQRLFSARNGRLAQTGETIVQTELSAILSGLRRQGAGYLHSGAVVGQFASGAQAVGMPLSAEELRRAVPQLVAPAVVPAGGRRYDAYFTPPASGGIVAAQIWRMLVEVEDYDGADAEERPHMLAEAVARANGERGRWAQGQALSPAAVEALVNQDTAKRLFAPYDDDRHAPIGAGGDGGQSPADVAAGFVVGDQWSSAVACSVTMNRLFGAGRVAEHTGVLLAAPPNSEAAAAIAAVVVGNRGNGDVRFAGAAGGGAAAGPALATVMLEAIEREEPIEAALAAPRVFHDGASERTLYEAALGPAGEAALRRRGHVPVATEALGRVSAFYCPRGLKDSGETCQVGADRRGHGLAQSAQ